MKMSRALLILGLLAVIVLRCGSAYQELNSVDDLKNIDLGQSVPKHTLLLLHWFANTVDIDNNNVVRLTFNPNNNYGSHPFGNHEGMLPQGGRYYTVGSLNRITSVELPEYVRKPLFRQYEGTNTDRIVFSVQDQNTGDHRINRVYITHHIGPSSESAYNRHHTYKVSNDLLHEIRQFSIEENKRPLEELRDEFDSGDYPLWDISNTWGDQAHLGLLVVIVCREHNQVCRRIQPGAIQQRDTIKLEVLTGRNGYAKIIWKGVDAELLKEQVAVVLFDDKEVQQTFKVIEEGNGCYQTSEALSEGLRADLHKVSLRWYGGYIVQEKICRGTRFPNLEAVLITGHQAYLQLFVRGGYACAQLYVKKSFTDWESEFYYSWVGFYKSAKKDTHDYAKWQWATKFTQSRDDGDSNTFEYCSGLAVETGVHARFIIKDYTKKASTPTWY